MNVREIAEICHEANRIYCEKIGDYSQPTWEHAPEWQVDSAIDGVLLHLSNPDLPDSASHNIWWQEKIDTGWILGPVKDAENKEHPCMVKFEELPLNQQVKDALFASIVRSLAPMLSKS